MSTLEVAAAGAGATARVVDRGGRVLAQHREALAPLHAHPGWVEQEPGELWRATLTAVRAVLDDASGPGVTGITLANERDTVLLWDRETLSSPRPAVVPGDRRASEVCDRLRAAGHEERVAALAGVPVLPWLAGPVLAWLQEEDRHTWAGVTSGRYAVGTLDSWLLARMTRGTWHLTDVDNAARTLLLDRTSAAWSDDLCSLFGVPRDALPELARGATTTTEPRAFVGLELPVTHQSG